MIATRKTSITLPTTLCIQAESLAQQLNISRNHLFALAIENFISNYQTQTVVTASSTTTDDQPAPDQQTSLPRQDAERALINQGDIYWVQLEEQSGSEAAIPHPHVIIQENLFNHSRINTVVACALTTNIKRASEAGNLLLEAGEANLPKQSVVEVSKVSSIDKRHLGEYIGSLTEQRTNQILAGMRFQHLSFFAR